MKKVLNILVILLLLCPNLTFAGQKRSGDEWTELHQQAWEAINAGDTEDFQRIFKKIKNPYAHHKRYGDTLLSSSITNGKAQIANWILDQGIDPNDQSKQLPLNNAVLRSSWYGNKMFTVIEKLIKSGADVNGKSNSRKQTPLHGAKLAGYDVVKILLEHGADPNTQDKWGQTPLHLFAGHVGEVQTIHLLITYGADASIKDKDGNTPLHKMIGHWLGEDSVKVAELLIGARANPKAKNKDGKTALDLLNSRKNPNMFYELKQALERMTK